MKYMAPTLKQTPKEVLLGAPALELHLKKMMELVDRVFRNYKKVTLAKSRASIQIVQKKMGELHPA